MLDRTQISPDLRTEPPFAAGAEEWVLRILCSQAVVSQGGGETHAVPESVASANTHIASSVDQSWAIIITSNLTDHFTLIRNSRVQTQSLYSRKNLRIVRSKIPQAAVPVQLLRLRPRL